MRSFKRLIFISAGLFLLNFSARGQFIPGAVGYDEIGLLGAYSDAGGSARMMGIGGAQVSLGGDIGSAVINPAGLGLYNRSEFSFTPSFNFINTDSRYFGDNGSDFDFRFNFSNIGIVFNKTRDDVRPGAWRGGSFGISVNKLADFNGKFFYSGENTQSSILDYWSDQAFGVNVNDIETDEYNWDQAYGMAYFSYLINPTSAFFDDGRNDEYIPVIFEDQRPFQEETVDSRGGRYGINFSYGGNFADRLYFGLGLGLNTFYYGSNKSYFEFIDAAQVNDPIVDFNLRENLTVQGIGINGVAGLIYRPLDFVRFGLSATTPTLYNLDSEFYNDLLNVDFGQGGDGQDYTDYELVMVDSTVIVDRPEDQRSALIVSEYKIKTPAKFSAGASVFVGKNGFISADVDYVNYGDMKITSNDFNTGEANQGIRNNYQSAFNYRIGGELRLDIFRLRAGYAYYGDPFKDESLSRVRTLVSGGAGIRVRSFFLDISAQSSQFDSRYYPYQVSLVDDLGDPVPQQPVNIKNKLSNISASIGFIF